MTEVTFEVWSNPKCSTCRKTLALLSEKGIHPQVRLYLEDPPSRQRLIEVLRVLKLTAREIVRTKESAYAELGLDGADEDRLIDAMVAHPVLIQRPIVLLGDRAVVARPPEKVLTLLA